MDRGEAGEGVGAKAGAAGQGVEDVAGAAGQAPEGTGTVAGGDQQAVSSRRRWRRSASALPGSRRATGFLSLRWSSTSQLQKLLRWER